MVTAQAYAACTTDEGAADACTLSHAQESPSHRAATTPAEADEAAERTATPGIIRYHGVAALVAGLVKDQKAVFALEVLGNEVAVKAVVNGLISYENRSLDTTGITIDGDAAALDKHGHYRMVTTPLSAGKVSCILLHQDCVIEAPQAQSGRRRRRQATEPDSNAASYGEMAGRAEFVFVTLAGEPAATTAPDGFSEMFASVLPLPSKREWADQLFQEGTTAGLVTQLNGHGTLAGYRISLNPVGWQTVIGDVVRERAPRTQRPPASRRSRTMAHAHHTR